MYRAARTYRLSCNKTIYEKFCHLLTQIHFCGIICRQLMTSLVNKNVSPAYFVYIQGWFRPLSSAYSCTFLPHRYSASDRMPINIAQNGKKINVVAYLRIGCSEELYAPLNLLALSWNFTSSLRVRRGRKGLSYICTPKSYRLEYLEPWLLTKYWLTRVWDPVEMQNVRA